MFLFVLAQYLFAHLRMAHLAEQNISPVDLPGMERARGARGSNGSGPPRPAERHHGSAGDGALRIMLLRKPIELPSCGLARIIRSSASNISIW